MQFTTQQLDSAWRKLYRTARYTIRQYGGPYPRVGDARPQFEILGTCLNELKAELADRGVVRLLRALYDRDEIFPEAA